MKQLAFLKNSSKAFGGTLMNTRKGRRGNRPLDTKNTMHLVLRSSKAVGDLSFKRHRPKVNQIIGKFSVKYGVRVLSVGNVGNHLHFHIKLGNRFAYKPFIRALTAAIMMAVTGASRWKKFEGKFWDYRPFTRVVTGLRAFLTLKDYIEINKMEGDGNDREFAKLVVTSLQPRWEPT